MISEFNLRHRISQVEVLPVAPIRKARMLLGIARNARQASTRLALLSRYHYRIDDPLFGARFHAASQRMGWGYEETRARAGRALNRTVEAQR